MNRFKLYSFGYLIGGFRTKAAAIRACNRRLKILTAAVNAGKYADPMCYDYDVRLGCRSVYSTGGWA